MSDLEKQLARTVSQLVLAVDYMRSMVHPTRAATENSVRSVSLFVQYRRYLSKVDDALIGSSNPEQRVSMLLETTSDDEVVRWLQADLMQPVFMLDDGRVLKVTEKAERP